MVKIGFRWERVPGGCILRGRKTNRIGTRWKERCQGERRGGSRALVSGSSLTDTMQIVGFVHGPPVNISNPDSSSVFRVCIAHCLLTPPLTCFKIFQTEAVFSTNPSNLALSDFPPPVKITITHPLAQSTNLGSIRDISFSFSSPISNA